MARQHEREHHVSGPTSAGKLRGGDAGAGDHVLEESFPVLSGGDKVRNSHEQGKVG